MEDELENGRQKMAWAWKTQPAGLGHMAGFRSGDAPVADGGTGPNARGRAPV